MNENNINKNQSKNTPLILIIILLVLVICFLVSYIVCDKFIEKKSSNTINTDYVDTFDSSEIGKVLVKGYATIEKIKEDCHSEEECLNAKYYDYVMFHIVDTKSENFKKFINDGQGNYYIGKDSIAIGCINNNIISYSNAENQKFITHKLAEEKTKMVMDATENNPVTLYLERTIENSYGRGVPVGICFSHMNIIDIIK